MDKFVIDTNVIIDFLAPSRPGHATACKLLRSFLAGHAEAVIPASSFKDAYYILCRWLGDEAQARADVQRVREFFGAAPLTTAILDRAFASDEPDFEDGIVRAFAEEYQAKGIVSRDEKAFRGSPVPRISPSECVKLLRIPAVAR